MMSQVFDSDEDEGQSLPALVNAADLNEEFISSKDGDSDDECPPAFVGTSNDDIAAICPISQKVDQKSCGDECYVL